MFPSGIPEGVFQRDDNIPVICSPVTISWDPRGRHEPSTDFAVYLVLLRGEAPAVDAKFQAWGLGQHRAGR